MQTAIIPTNDLNIYIADTEARLNQCYETK